MKLSVVPVIFNGARNDSSQNLLVNNFFLAALILRSLCYSGMFGRYVQQSYVGKGVRGGGASAKKMEKKMEMEAFEK